jgi:hypothetical protein
MTDEVIPFPVRDLPWQLEAEVPEAQKPGKADLQLWSVTTIIRQIGGADGLINWAVGKTATAAIHEQDIWQPMIDRGLELEAVRYISGARWRPRPGCSLTDADAGSLFHKLAERWIFEGKRPPCDVPEVSKLLDSFEQWLKASNPTFDALEMTVYHPDEGYAGTLDAILNVDGRRFVLDYKTTLDSDEGRRKRPWHSVAPQLAAYRHAKYVAVWKARTEERYSRRYYLLSEDERRNALPMPEIEGGYCLHVSPWHADLYYVRTGEDIYRDGFLAAVDAARWTLRLADTAIDEEGATYLNTGTGI